MPAGGGSSVSHGEPGRLMGGTRARMAVMTKVITGIGPKVEVPVSHQVEGLGHDDHVKAAETGGEKPVAMMTALAPYTSLRGRPGW